MAYVVKANYDFNTNEHGELPLKAGDIVLVTQQIDASWLQGSLGNQSGIFPAGFVQRIDVPQLQFGQKMFVATETFHAQAHGDLGFQTGDIVIGTKMVDANWWQGKCHGKSGIFPLTHTRIIDIPASPTPQANATSHMSPMLPAQPNLTQTTAKCKGRAIMDSVAQIDEELSFNSGDVITISEEVDQVFYRGECNGKVGIFPMHCVEIIEGKAPSPKVQEPTLPSRKNFDWFKSDSVAVSSPNVTMPHQNRNSYVDPQQNRSSYTAPEQNSNAYANSQQNRNSFAGLTQACSNESKKVSWSASVSENKPAKMIRQDATSIDNFQSVDNFSFTPTNINVTENNGPPVSSFQGDITPTVFTSDNTKSHDSAITPYGRTLHAFMAENTNELTFMENEIITLICHIDDQWTEGEIDGKRGIFPTSFIEIIVDCDYLKDSSGDVATNNNMLSYGYGTGGEEKQGKGIHTFVAETDEDLTVLIGDIVTVLNEPNENWYFCRDDKNNTGLCPADFIQIIGSRGSSSQSIHVDPYKDPYQPVSPAPQQFPMVSKNTQQPPPISKPSKPRSPAIQTSASLDDLITVQMRKARSDSDENKRKSLQLQKPPRPAPVRKDSLNLSKSQGSDYSALKDPVTSPSIFEKYKPVVPPPPSSPPPSPPKSPTKTQPQRPPPRPVNLPSPDKPVTSSVQSGNAVQPEVVQPLNAAGVEPLRPEPVQPLRPEPVQPLRPEPVQPLRPTRPAPKPPVPVSPSYNNQGSSYT
ncbi:unnamed protein product, partial [Owenia fusiformis]